MSNPVSRVVRKFWPKMPDAERQFRQIIKTQPRGGVFVDLGANVGTVTEWALGYGHHVYAFEPDPVCLAELHRKFDGNPRVTIIPKAVGATSRTAKLYRRADEQTEWSSLLRHDVHDGDVINVEVIDIVEFTRTLGKVTMIKMDIEGAEAECLDALIDTGVYREVGVILVETHERFSPELATRLDGVRARIAEGRITNINLDWV